MPEEEVCVKCIMLTEINRIKEDIRDGKMANKELAKNLSDIRDSHMETKFLMQQITNTQTDMANANTVGFKTLFDKEKAKEEREKKRKEKYEENKEKEALDRAKEKRQNKWMLIFFAITYAVGSLGAVIKWFMSK